MEALKIAATDDSPEISMDAASGKLEISGKSLPEDVMGFYKPVSDWLEAYRKSPNDSTLFKLKLVYFNTASSKLIMDLMMILEEVMEDGKDVKVEWHSHTTDEDMKEAGLEFDEMIDIPFEHLSYE